MCSWGWPQHVSQPQQIDVFMRVDTALPLATATWCVHVSQPQQIDVFMRVATALLSTTENWCVHEGGHSTSLNHSKLMCSWGWIQHVSQPQQIDVFMRVDTARISTITKSCVHESGHSNSLGHDKLIFPWIWTQLFLQSQKNITFANFNVRVLLSQKISTPLIADTRILVYRSSEEDDSLATANKYAYECEHENVFYPRQISAFMIVATMGFRAISFDCAERRDLEQGQ
jgi:hypothetical protein